MGFLCNVPPEAAHKGLHEIYLKLQKIEKDMCLTNFYELKHRVGNVATLAHKVVDISECVQKNKRNITWVNHRASFCTSGQSSTTTQVRRHSRC
jgi:hypothetical protein